MNWIFQQKRQKCLSILTVPWGPTESRQHNHHGVGCQKNYEGALFWAVQARSHILQLFPPRPILLQQNNAKPSLMTSRLIQLAGARHIFAPGWEPISTWDLRVIRAEDRPSSEALSRLGKLASSQSEPLSNHGWFPIHLHSLPELKN